ncbi:lipopolysaccharide export system permease protein [Advenella incenata]|jgi:lipopolysaccharide export system permease protein|uniref:Lipopolysaccharide export system permease protein n=1 Tax=Advenella incenata TaxID=267800 RepID=A0A4Q7VST0_9BURK|nr:LPS export ABC transporter permease LptG [Advenella incenata]RZT99414.1 lipopolysaccharide export system permease protein [Advenella incenata]
MRTARKYLGTEIYRSTVAVLVALVGLFTFFALIDELDSISDKFPLLSLLYLQVLQLPTRLYDLLPIGLLIGSVLALASLAQRNELVILRVSGVSSISLLLMLWTITIPLMLGAFVLSEFVTPRAELMTSEASLKYLGKASGGQMNSGHWFREPDDDGNIRTINIAQLRDQGSVQDIRIITYNVDESRFISLDHAKTGHFSQNTLTLTDVVHITSLIDAKSALADPNKPVADVARRTVLPTLELKTTLTPNRLLAGQMQPDRMSTVSLLDYISYLEENKLQTNRQVVALWRKLSYPFTLLVMITIAAPIGFMQTRKGGVGGKVFLGILLGVAFYMINQLALNVGMLKNLPPWFTALMPNTIAMLIAMLALYFMEARRTPRMQRAPLSGKAVT